MHRSSIDGVEATSADTTQTFARHSHERFGIGLVVRGGQRSSSGRGPVEARAGDAITVNPGEVHDGSPLDEQGRVWHMLYVSPALMDDVARDLEVRAGSSLEIERPVLRDARFAALFERAYCGALAGDASIGRLAGEEAVFALLADVVSRHTTVCVPARSGVRGRTGSTSCLDTAAALCGPLPTRIPSSAQIHPPASVERTMRCITALPEAGKPMRPGPAAARKSVLRPERQLLSTANA